MGLSTNYFDVGFRVYYRVKSMLHEETYLDAYTIYTADDPKNNVDIYEGNIQITRSFDPPSHVPLFDPREKRGISIHHQLGSRGFHTGTGLFSGILEQPFLYHGYTTANAPRLYIGVRRTGSPKWFYKLPANVNISSYKGENIYDKDTRSKTPAVKTSIYVSGSEGFPDYDPMDIRGLDDTSTDTESRVLQLHVSYMPNGDYYLLMSDQRTKVLGGGSFFGRVWIPLKNDGTY